MLLLSKNCETLIKETHKKPQETLEFKLTQPRATFFFKAVFNLGYYSNCMIGLLSLEVFNSIFKIIEENIRFELYTDNFDEFSFEELKDELEEVLNNSDITPSPLRHETLRPRSIQAYKNKRTKNQALMVILC